MRPVEPTKTCSARHVQVASRARRHFARIGQALFAGAGVGVAGIHDERLRDALFHALDANFHRRGANLIGREHAGDGRRDFGNDQRKVALLSLVRAFAGAEAFDVAKHAAGQKAVGATMEPGISLNCFFILQTELNNKAKPEEQSFYWPSLIVLFVTSLLNFHRINFQPHHADVDFAFCVGRMFGDVTLRDGGDEFLAQIFRHALDIRQPRRPQPRGEDLPRRRRSRPSVQA